MPFSLQHKSLLSKLLLLTLILSAVTLALPPSTFASETLTNDQEPKIKVLCYHHIVPEPLQDNKATVVTLSEFKEQMEYLYEHGYYSASLEDIEEFLHNKKQLPENTVLITFDDGYESNYIYAYPILKKYDFNAVIFLIGSRIAQAEKDPNAIPKLSFSQIQEMAASGLVEFGNHTFDAHDFQDGKPLLQIMTYEEIVADFEKLNMLFEEIGIPQPTSIAYPFGRYSDNAIQAAKMSGSNIGFTVNYGFVYQDSPTMQLNRIIVPSNLEINEFKALLQDELSPLPEGFEDSILLPFNSDTAYVMGKPVLLRAPIEMINGVCLAPLNFFTEQLNWDLIWEPALFQVAIKPSNNSTSFVCLAAYMINDEIMVPVIPLANAMGYKALYLENDQMMKLKKP